MRKFLLALVFLLGAFFVIGHFAEMQKVWETLQSGDWRVLAFAVIVEIAWVVNMAASFRAIYRALGIEEDVFRLALLSMAANFINVIAPSAGMGGMAVFINEARQRGYSPARATLAGALYIFFDYVGFLSFLALGFIVLIRRNNLTTAEIFASGLLAAIALGIGIILYLGMRSEQRLESFLTRMAHLVNRILNPILHRDYLSIQRAHEFATDAAEGLLEIRRDPRGLILPAALAFSNKLFMTSVLFLMFLAFRVPLSIGTLIASFCISFLFTIISPTPSGIGIVETALALALSSFYVPLSAAAVITLAYRGFTFWLPLLLGFVAMRIIGRPIDLNTQQLSG